MCVCVYGSPLLRHSYTAPGESLTSIADIIDNSMSRDSAGSPAAGSTYEEPLTKVDPTGTKARRGNRVASASLPRVVRSSGSPTASASRASSRASTSEARGTLTAVDNSRNSRGQHTDQYAAAAREKNSRRNGSTQNSFFEA